MNVRLELALLRLGRWPYTLDPYPHRTFRERCLDFRPTRTFPRPGKPMRLRWAVSACPPTSKRQARRQFARQPTTGGGR